MWEVFQAWLKKTCISEVWSPFRAWLRARILPEYVNALEIQVTLLPALPQDAEFTKKLLLYFKTVISHMEALSPPPYHPITPDKSVWQVRKLPDTQWRTYHHKYAHIVGIFHSILPGLTGGGGYCCTPTGAYYWQQWLPIPHHRHQLRTGVLVSLDWCPNVRTYTPPSGDSHPTQISRHTWCLPTEVRRRVPQKKVTKTDIYLCSYRMRIFSFWPFYKDLHLV